MIITPSYDCYDVAFCTCLCTLFTAKKLNKQTNKQTNKTFTRFAKRSFKTQLENTFYLIKLEHSEAFGEK